MGGGGRGRLRLTLIAAYPFRRLNAAFPGILDRRRRTLARACWWCCDRAAATGGAAAAAAGTRRRTRPGRRTRQSGHADRGGTGVPARHDRVSPPPLHRARPAAAEYCRL